MSDPGLRLTILGSGAAFATTGHNAGACIDGSLLLDCGAPALALLPACGLDPAAVEVVCLSHFHADHCFHLPVLLAARRFEQPLAPPLTVVGPAGTADHVDRLLRLAFGDRLRDQVMGERPPRFVELADGGLVDLGRHRLEAVTVVHVPHLPCLAFRISRDGITLGYSGDTTWCDGIRALARRVDYLLCECTGSDEPDPVHLDRTQVLALMGEAPATRFILTHLRHRRPLPGALLASDGLTLTLGRP
ncbi:MAG TPA: ribonuclease Z [Candidatus Dormibacteraeota bacterium]|nr:ribonuclease Z [Candidatus Dormibacteraeota bacterium]